MSVFISIRVDEAETGKRSENVEKGSEMLTMKTLNDHDNDDAAGGEGEEEDVSVTVTAAEGEGGRVRAWCCCCVESVTSVTSMISCIL